MAPDQDDLFNWKPPQKPRALARSHDLATSHLAAASIEGGLPALEAEVLGAIRRGGGLTVDELVDATGLEKVTVSPRLRPLCNKHLIREAEFTRPGKSGRQQTVWIAERQ